MHKVLVVVLCALVFAPGTGGGLTLTLRFIVAYGPIRNGPLRWT